MSDIILTQVPAQVTLNFVSLLTQCNLILRLSCRLCNSSTKSSKSIFSAHTLSTESSLTLPNLSLVTEFLGNFFRHFVFEKFLSHEALMTGSVTATITIKRSCLSSYKSKKLFERYRQLRRLTK